MRGSGETMARKQILGRLVKGPTEMRRRMESSSNTMRMDNGCTKATKMGPS